MLVRVRGRVGGSAARLMVMVGEGLRLLPLRVCACIFPAPVGALRPWTPGPTHTTRPLRLWTPLTRSSHHCPRFNRSPALTSSDIKLKDLRIVMKNLKDPSIFDRKDDVTVSEMRRRVGPPRVSFEGSRCRTV